MVWKNPIWFALPIKTNWKEERQHVEPTLEENLDQEVENQQRGELIYEENQLNVDLDDNSDISEQNVDD